MSDDELFVDAQSDIEVREHNFEVWKATIHKTAFQERLMELDSASNPPASLPAYHSAFQTAFAESLQRGIKSGKEA